MGMRYALDTAEVRKWGILKRNFRSIVEVHTLYSAFSLWIEIKCIEVLKMALLLE
jgi:hypothetical protein